MHNIIGHKNIFLAISGILVLAALAVMLGFGFHQGIDFSGGTLWKFQIATATPSVSELGNFIQKNLNLADVRINFDAANSSYLVRLPTLAEAGHQKLAEALNCEASVRLVPEKDLDALLDERSTELAREIIAATSGSTAIELQLPDQKFIDSQLQKTKEDILKYYRSALWQES